MVLLEEYQPIEKKKNGLNKEVINVIRTTQRNNVELTHLADNKANVLLSLNAIMITFLIPSVVSNIEYVMVSYLWLPLTILAISCFLTIYISTMVLKPSKFDNARYFKENYHNHSPLYFGNIYKKSPEEFYGALDKAFKGKENIMEMLKQSLFFSGKRLAYKMTWIRRAFNIFLLGLFISLLSTVGVFLFGS